MRITIFHNAGDFSYLYGLVNGLSKIKDISIDIIDSEQSIAPFKGLHQVKVFTFILPYKKTLNLFYRIFRVFNPYVQNIIYAIKTDSKIFHIQWFNRIHNLDKLLLVNIYHLLNKKIIYTAHNVNTLERNNKDNLWNRKTLKYFYKKVDHIIVHNKKSREELIQKFNVGKEKISVIKFGLNIFTPKKGISKEEAVDKLNLPLNKKLILFFGAINTYKGLEFLLDAYKKILESNNEFHLIIAGESRDNDYFKMINDIINRDFNKNDVSTFFRYIDEDEIEYFFMAADCLVLPYRAISQSGVHFLSYTFGLPVIATDVGSFKDEDIIEGETGFICEAENSEDLKNTLIKYFNSDLYKNLELCRGKIKSWAGENYNWDNIAVKTFNCYMKLYKEGV